MIRILGAGAWGSALAILWADAPDGVELVARTSGEAEAMRSTRQSRRLPGFSLPDGVRVAHPGDLAALGQDDLLVVAVPSDAIAATVPGAAAGASTVIVATKGLTPAGLRPSEALAAVGIEARRTLVLSGPNLAREIASGLPAAAVIAGEPVEAERVQRRLGRPRFRLYRSEDPIGVEVSGALKNVIAIAVSAVRSLGYGENAAAALLSRGVAEMARLAEACGGRSETASGLAGVGDLVLTSSNTGSRNARLGELLAGGATVAEAVATIGATVEGIPTAHGALAVAARLGVELPITATVVAALERGVPIESLAQALLGRAQAQEFR